MSLALAGLLLVNAAAQVPGCAPPPAFEKLADLRSNVPVEKSGPGLWIAGTRFRGEDIAFAAADRDPATSTWAIDLRLTRSGKAKFDAIQRCRGNRLVEVSLDEVALARPNLVEPIDGAVVRIAGGFGAASAAEHAERISRLR